MVILTRKDFWTCELLFQKMMSGLWVFYRQTLIHYWLSGLPPLTHRKKIEEVVVGHCYARLTSEGSSATWYIATFEGKNDDGTNKMDNLMRVQDGRNSKWKHLPKRDLLNFHFESILGCKIDGKWNVSNERSITFLLRNHIQIIVLVERKFLIFRYDANWIIT